MNPDKFTHKTNEALTLAHELASEAGHAQMTPLHLAAALAADRSGVLRQAIAHASGGNDVAAADSFERVVAAALKRLPTQSPLPDTVPASPALVKVIRRAQSAQKGRGDSHLAVDQLLVGLLEDPQVSDALKEAGVAASRVKAVVEKLRGDNRRGPGGVRLRGFQLPGAQDVRPRPGRGGGQARPGHWPRRGDPARGADPVAAHEEQPRPHRRA